MQLINTHLLHHVHQKAIFWFTCNCLNGRVWKIWVIQLLLWRLVIFNFWQFCHLQQYRKNILHMYKNNFTVWFYIDPILFKMTTINQVVVVAAQSCIGEFYYVYGYTPGLLLTIVTSFIYLDYLCIYWVWYHIIYQS